MAALYSRTVVVRLSISNLFSFPSFSCL